MPKNPCRTGHTYTLPNILLPQRELFDVFWFLFINHRSVRAAINLEAAGTTGRELLFQATSEEMIKAYSQVPRYPIQLTKFQYALTINVTDRMEQLLQTIFSARESFFQSAFNLSLEPWARCIPLPIGSKVLSSLELISGSLKLT